MATGLSKHSHIKFNAEVVKYFLDERMKYKNNI